MGHPVGHDRAPRPRRGPRPATTARTPHVQLDQWSPEPLQAELWERMSALAGVRTGASMISAPSSRALHLLPGAAAPGARGAFLVHTELAHLHGDGSGSLHVGLPRPVVEEVLATGWGESHPAVAAGLTPPTTVAVYGPRDAAELEVVWGLVRTSHACARGEGGTAPSA